VGAIHGLSEQAVLEPKPGARAASEGRRKSRQGRGKWARGGSPEERMESHGGSLKQRLKSGDVLVGGILTEYCR
jgi:hypothetical protein